MTIGTDISTFPVLDDTFTPISGGRVLSEAIARRLTTPRGAMPFDPDYGTDLRAWLNESFDVGREDELRDAIVAECLKDERVQGAEVSFTYNARAYSLTVRIALATSSGPHDLTLDVTALSVALLEG